MPDQKWQPAEFEIAFPDGPLPRNGLIYRGLGLHVWLTDDLEAKWTLTHLASGHALIAGDGDARSAMPAATEIAECADWSFTASKSPKGSGLGLKVREIVIRHGIDDMFAPVRAEAGASA